MPYVLSRLRCVHLLIATFFCRSTKSLTSLTHQGFMRLLLCAPGNFIFGFLITRLGQTPVGEYLVFKFLYIYYRNGISNDQIGRHSALLAGKKN